MASPSSYSYGYGYADSNVGDTRGYGGYAIPDQRYANTQPARVTGFEVEQSPHVSGHPLGSPVLGQDGLFRTAVSRLLAVKARPVAISGRIQVQDPASLSLFFRSKVHAQRVIRLPIAD